MMYLIWIAFVTTISIFCWFATHRSWFVVISFIGASFLSYFGLNEVRGIPARCDLSYIRTIEGYYPVEDKIYLLLDDPEYCYINYDDIVMEQLQKPKAKGSKLRISNRKGEGGTGGIEQFGYEENPVVTTEFPKVPYTK